MLAAEKSLERYEDNGRIAYDESVTALALTYDLDERRIRERIPYTLRSVVIFSDVDFEFD